MDSNITKLIHDWFQHFHTHPETSLNEVETTNKLAEILDSMGVTYRRFDDVTGLVTEIGSGDEVIAVRADIDALWQKVNGTFQANHSCGHDANISMVLGALAYLKDETLTKRIRFIFQPAEEKGNGANAMIERGVMDDVSYLFGIHLRPIEELGFGQVSPAIHHGAAVFLEGQIQGIDAHGARPHQGKNAIDVLFAIQQLLKNIYLSPFEPYSVKLTNVQAGGESLNIIPGSASFAIDLRAQRNSVLSDIQEQIEKGLLTISDLHMVSISSDWIDLTPGAEVSKDAAAIAEVAIREVVGDANTMPAVVTPGSDDFHFYTIHDEALKATMIGIGADLQPGLHHPDMTFNHEALEIGARTMAKTLIKHNDWKG